MSAPTLRRDRLRWRYRLTYRRWWSHRRGNCARHEQKDHQPASHERQNEHSNGKPGAAALRLCRAGYGSRAGHPRRIPARCLPLAGIRPAVEARTGDGSRRVRSAPGILAHPKTTNADRSPYAGFGQVEPERSKFDALTKSPCHVPAILPRQSRPTRQASETPGSPAHQRRGRIAFLGDNLRGCRGWCKNCARIEREKRCGDCGDFCGEYLHVGACCPLLAPHPLVSVSNNLHKST